jgi:hypothetical protein
MFLESKTTALIDSLEIASIKFLNSVSERGGETVAAASPAAPASVRPSPAASAAAASARGTI